MRIVLTKNYEGAMVSWIRFGSMSQKWFSYREDGKMWGRTVEEVEFR